MALIELRDLDVTYAAALDDVPIVAFLARPDGTISYVSPQWTVVIGTDTREVLGDTYPMLIHPDQRARALQTWEAARAAGSTYHDEMLLRFGNGLYRWILSEANPVRDPMTREIIGWFGTVTDINERKRADETLRAQVEFNERLIDASEDCIKILDLDARIVSMSPNGQRNLRIRNMETIVGTSWLEFWGQDDRISAKAAVEAAIRGETGRFTGYFPVEDEPRWFDVVVTAILDAEGRPDKLLAVSRDVTTHRLTTDALIESEQRYRAFSEALPGMTWSASPDGRLNFVPERWTQTRGRERESALGDAWLDGLHPEDREQTRQRWNEAVTTGKPYETQFRVAMADGIYRWQLVRALPLRDDAGNVVRWIGVNIDIDDQRRADAGRDMFVSLAENSSDFISISDTAGNVVYINEAGRQLLEMGSADADDGRSRHLFDYFCSDDLQEVRSEILPTLERDGRWIGDYHFRNFRTGVPIPVSVNCFQLYDRAGAVTGLATLSRDRRDRDRIQAGLQLLSRTGASTLDLLDYATTLRNIAAAFVPDFASYCIIDVRTPQHLWQRTVVHRDKAKEPLIRDLSEPSGRHPIALALEHGTSSRVVVSEAWLNELDDPTDRTQVVEALGVQSFITVPVAMPNGEVVGGLTAARDANHKSGNYHDEDMSFVQEAGRRAGVAIANARLYERERRIAVELQAASLPATLPSLQNLHLNAEYRPGSDEATIGGDWYDAFVLEDGRVAITLGDVLGHGLHAAVTMTKLRQAMQSAAMVDPDPNVMLRVADKTLRLLDSDRYATALAAIYDPDGLTLTFASAGHPGPVVRTPDGNVGDHSSAGLMLGLRNGDEASVGVIQTPPGSTIVLFTDGLVEATRDLSAGYDRLSEALCCDAVLSNELPARAIVEYVLGAVQASDDIAVLVMQTGPAPDPQAFPARQSTYRDGIDRSIGSDGNLSASSSPERPSG